MRDEGIGKKWIYLERNMLQGQSVGHLRGRELWQGTSLSVFIELGNFIG